LLSALRKVSDFTSANQDATMDFRTRQGGSGAFAACGAGSNSNLTGRAIVGCTLNRLGKKKKVTYMLLYLISKSISYRHKSLWPPKHQVAALPFQEWQPPPLQWPSAKIPTTVSCLQRNVPKACTGDHLKLWFMVLRVS